MASGKRQAFSAIQVEKLLAADHLDEDNLMMASSRVGFGDDNGENALLVHPKKNSFPNRLNRLQTVSKLFPTSSKLNGNENVSEKSQIAYSGLHPGDLITTCAASRDARTSAAGAKHNEMNTEHAASDLEKIRIETAPPETT
ncbi:hypothetical protein R3P38DRAFT_3379679 [Favolaschia claudopus]|uniref:Uncharacterized protein n=1 Tax=Favolaschia claudopus TaxID=2862362 RepID=A0AAV9Z4T0_9AGAR